MMSFRRSLTSCCRKRVRQRLMACVSTMKAWLSSRLSQRLWSRRTSRLSRAAMPLLSEPKQFRRATVLRLAPAVLSRDNSLSLYPNGCQIIEKNMQDGSSGSGGFEATEGFDGSSFVAPTRKTQPKIRWHAVLMPEWCSRLVLWLQVGFKFHGRGLLRWPL